MELNVFEHGSERALFSSWLQEFTVRIYRDENITPHYQQQLGRAGRSEIDISLGVPIAYPPTRMLGGYVDLVVHGDEEGSVHRYNKCVAISMSQNWGREAMCNIDFKCLDHNDTLATYTHTYIEPEIDSDVNWKREGF